jgi:Subtilase family
MNQKRSTIQAFWHAAAVLLVLALPAVAGAQSSKLVHAAGTAVPGQYIVVLAGTDLNPPMPADPAEPEVLTGASHATQAASLIDQPVDPTPTPTPEPTPEPTPVPPEPLPAPFPEPGPDLAPDPGVTSTAADLTATYGGTAGTSWSDALKGFVVQASEAQALAMSQDPRVLWIEEDGIVEGAAVQLSPPLGLDRIDQRNRPTDSRFVYNSDGTGVEVYVIDTGIKVTHQEFLDGTTRRAFKLYTAWRDPTDDCSGHGTHVAGTIGGKTYGVAKKVRLYAMRVLDCDKHGTLSNVIAAVNYVTSIRQQIGHANIPMVVNMSLTFQVSGDGALDVAVRNSISKRIVYVVAAGNLNQNAQAFTPARVAEAITVGATQSNDQRAVFDSGGASNYGLALDLFAPGKGILSSWIGSDTATLVGEGTSMAAPHVAGVAALYLQRHPTANAATVRNALVSLATSNVVVSPGTGSPNKLLYTNY